tara:strand:+ start:3997 stop:4899 length:903 start_codon:yes stop_codon:yes gene_type:complete
MRFYKYSSILLLGLAIKFWFFQPYIVVSDSMANTLNKGDYIIMNTWEKSLFRNHKTLQKNDIFAFYYPLDSGTIKDKTVYVKRCIGMPGEWIKIDANQKNSKIAGLKYDFILEDPYDILNQDHLLKMGIKQSTKLDDKKWILTLNNIQKKEIQEWNSTFELKMIVQNKNEFDSSVFPSDPIFPWNQDFYGPLYVPKNGDSILLNVSNISLYKKIIEDYENHSIKYENELFKIDGNLCSHYIFDQDYFFVAGDNRHHSFDSRHFGFIPEDHIISSIAIQIINLENLSITECFKSIEEWIKN